MHWLFRLSLTVACSLPTIALAQDLPELSPEEKREAALEERVKKRVEERMRGEMDKSFMEGRRRLLNDFARTEEEALRNSIEEAKKRKDEYQIDLPISASPAFTGLQLTPLAAPIGSTPRAFSLELLNGVDYNGNYQVGIAADTKPLRLWHGGDLDMPRYRNNYWYRFLNRMQASFAITRGINDADGAQRYALGFRWTFFDLGDPLRDVIFGGEVDDAFESSLFPLRTAERNEYTDKQRRYLSTVREGRRRLNEDLPRQIEEAAERARQRNALRTNLSIGWSPSWIAKDGRNSHLKSNGGNFWFTAAYGFDGPRKWVNSWLKKYMQVILHGRMRHNEDIPRPNSNNGFLEQRTYLWSVRVRAGGPSLYFNTELQVVYARPHRSLFKRDRYYVAGTSVEYRLIKDVWFELGLSAQGRRDFGENESAMQIAIRWGVK